MAGRRLRLTRRGRAVASGLPLVLAGAAFLGVREVVPARAPVVGGRNGPRVVALPAPGPSPSAGQPRPPLVAMARVGSLQLFLPTRRAVGLAYHEASYRDALALHPLGRCVRDANRTKFRPPPPSPGPSYVVMASRGRPDPATSALDVALRAGQPVLSPVTGTVVGVRWYLLYGRYPDVRINLRPDAAPGLRVVLIHLRGVRVRRGERVVAGWTVLGYPRLFPFSSQVNDYVGAGIPHIHVEVKRGHQGR